MVFKAGSNSGYFAFFQPAVVPVSYTHLDVYKRQDVGRPDHGADMQHLLAGIVDPIGLDPHQVFPLNQSGAVVVVELLDRVSAGRLHLWGLDPKNRRLSGFQDKPIQFSSDSFGFAAVFLVLMDNAVIAQIEILCIVVEELNVFIGRCV